MELIKRINNLESFTSWAEGYRSLLYPGQYRSAFKRKYIELGWKVSGRPPVYERALSDPRAVAIAQACRCSGENIFLLCHYEAGGGIREHRDDTGYGKNAYCLSSTDFVLVHHAQAYECKAGEVWKFNSKAPHSVPALSEERWCLLWWEPDPRYF